MKRGSLLASFFWISLPLAAQPAFKTETSLALVRFHVTHDNKYVLNLKPEDFELLEDGKPREFTVFEHGPATDRTVPVNLVLLFDISGSVTGARLLNGLVFKENLLDGLENVFLSVYGFSDELRRYTKPTRDLAVLDTAIRAVGDQKPAETIELKALPKRTATRPGTWIYESIIATAHDSMPQPDVHSVLNPPEDAQDAAPPLPTANVLMLVFSDGLNTTSSIPEDAISVCQELGVTVYPVVLGHRALLEQLKTFQDRAAKDKTDARANALVGRVEAQLNEVQRFGRMGDPTGGRGIDLPQISLDVIKQILIYMVGQIRHQYTIGFVPETGPKPRAHKLEVRLVDKSTGQLSGGKRTVAY